MSSPNRSNMNIHVHVHDHYNTCNSNSTVSSSQSGCMYVTNGAEVARRFRQSHLHLTSHYIEAGLPHIGTYMYVGIRPKAHVSTTNRKHQHKSSTRDKTRRQERSTTHRYPFYMSLRKSKTIKDPHIQPRRSIEENFCRRYGHRDGE
jgi:hypothetical protein